jgi:hypothetical protein
MLFLTEPFGDPDVGLIGNFALLVEIHDSSPLKKGAPHDARFSGFFSMGIGTES